MNSYSLRDITSECLGMPAVIYSSTLKLVKKTTTASSGLKKRRRRRRGGGQFPLPIAAFAVPGPSSARQPPPSPPPPPPPPPAMHFCEEMAERYASSVDSV
nr:unnamed protein product [Callosobruchus chinensis]